jgi:hypothetical protein
MVLQLDGNRKDQIVFMFGPFKDFREPKSRKYSREFLSNKWKVKIATFWVGVQNVNICFGKCVDNSRFVPIN